MSKYSMAVLAACLMAVVLFGLAFFPEAHVAKAALKTIIVPDDYPTIQAAIGNATDGDTVFTRNGVYYTEASGWGHEDGLTINKSISLIGEDSQKTILKPDWTGRYSPDAGILITADGVTISGLTINGASDNATYGAFFFNTTVKGYQQKGIKIASNASGSKIIDNILLNSAPYQIEDSGDNSIIAGNNITSDNSIRPPYDDSGIFLNSLNSIVYNNTITQFGYIGILVSDSENLTIYSNKIAGNGVNHSFHSEEGIGGLQLANSGNGSVYVYGNDVTDNFGFGIAFDQSNNCIVYNNNINGNHNGFYLKNYVLTNSNSRLGSGNILFNNNLIDNDKSVVIEYDYSYPAGLNNSSVIGNGTSQVLWDNGKLGNFWSDYRLKYPNASEIDNSGIGNTPYVIDENNTDHYPLTHQVDISATAPAPTPSPSPSLSPSPSIPEVPSKIILSVAVIAIVFAAIIVRTKKKNRS